MRLALAAMACLAILSSGPMAGGARAEMVKVTPQLTVFSSQQSKAPYGRPTVLRGSGLERGAADGYRRHDAGRTGEDSRIDAGDTLWLTDVASGELVACDLRRTSKVGQRVIRCAARDLRLD